MNPPTGLLLKDGSNSQLDCHGHLPEFPRNQEQSPQYYYQSKQDLPHNLVE
jgi:hypothetical protein